MVPQDHIEEIIEVGNWDWLVCAEEDKSPVESEQKLFSKLLNIMEEDFGVTLEPTPSHTLYEEETIGELQQDELVWKSMMEQYKDELYQLSDNADDTEPPHAVAVGGSHNILDNDDDAMDREANAEGE
jgi:hypothetical protein